ncbi:MAG: hypothetical protein LQ344_001864 [Seirophora lacunosa]|nr:MAG: hypothetical protein LQ344_001864 [Seirophora lacunosa]
MQFLRDYESLQLDIVGLFEQYSLAILGEASVESSARISALSWTFLLPRLIPAPQALIRASRPERLEPATAKVVGAYSGGQRDHVNYIAHLLHEGESLKPYSVRCERIIKEIKDPEVKAKSWGPTTMLALLGFAMSCALLALSIHEGDGMALLATILLSSLSTLVGIGSQWRLVLPERTATRNVPKSDVVIRYPHGAFLVIKCDEEVARSLYWAPEECRYYRSTRSYRVISLIGTLILMFGVICLGNAGLNVQLGFAASYIILNAAYWTVAALPQQWNWDLSRYKRTIEHYQDKEENSDVPSVEKKRTYTSALWRAIALSGTGKWVRVAGAAPVSGAWDMWLQKAEEVIKEHPCKFDDRGPCTLPRWDPEKYLDDVHAQVQEAADMDKFQSSGDPMV